MLGRSVLLPRQAMKANKPAAHNRSGTWIQGGRNPSTSLSWPVTRKRMCVRVGSVSLLSTWSVVASAQLPLLMTVFWLLRANMYVYMPHACMYIYIHIYICTYIPFNKCVYIYIYADSYICMQISASTPETSKRPKPKSKTPNPKSNPQKNPKTLKP